LGDDLPAGVEEGAHIYGECGYYESTERYPNNPDVWGDNAGKPMRFVVMPDVADAPIISNNKTGGVLGSINLPNSDVYINKLGLRSPNIETIIDSLPSEIKAQMEGWEIVRADRRNNKRVLASGIIQNMRFTDWSEGTDQASIDAITAGGNAGADLDDDFRLYQNFPLNDLRPDFYVRSPIPAVGPLGLTQRTPNPNYRKDVFSFVSPDTSFNKNMLFQGDAIVHGLMYGTAMYSNAWLSPYPELKDKGNDSDLSAYQSVVVGHYNNYKRSAPGNIRRKLKESMYIPFNAQVSGGNAGIPVHNITRNSTVLLAMNKSLADPDIQDTSQMQVYRDAGGWPDGKTATGMTSSHYVSIISNIANQYGGVFDARWCSTNQDETMVKNNQVFFGGDSYLGAFANKRQMVFFKNAQAYINFDDGSEGVDLKTSESIKSVSFNYLAARKNAKRDSRTEGQDPGGFLDTGDLGFLPVIYTGIPYFFCESDYNLDLRMLG
jgi:hypothetical protein